MTQGRSKDTLTRGTALGLLSEAMILPTGIVSAAVLTRSLGPDGYGLIGVVMAAISPVAWLITSVLGLRSSVKIVGDANNPLEAASALLRANLILGSIGAVLFAFAAPWIAAALGHPGITLALILGSFEILLMPVARSHRDALVGVRSYSNAGIAGGVFHVARLATIILLLLLGVGIETVVCAHIVGRLGEILWCRAHVPVPLLLKFKLATPATARIVGPTFANAVCLRIADSVDLLLLSALGAGTTVLGHYSAAVMLTQIPRMLNLIVGPGLIVAISSALRAGDTALAAAIREDASRLVAAVLACLLVGAGAAPTVLTVLFGAPFEAGTGILRLLLIGGAGIIVFGITTAEFVAENRPWAPVAISLPMVMLNVALLFVLVPRFGAEGAALATSVAFVASGVASVCLMAEGKGRRVRHLSAGIIAGLAGGGIATGLAAAAFPVLDLATGSLVALLVLSATGVVDREIVLRFTRSYPWAKERGS